MKEQTIKIIMDITVKQGGNKLQEKEEYKL